MTTPAEAAKQLAAQAPKTPEVIATFLKNAQVLLITETRNCFRNSRDPDGVAWKPLKFNRPQGGNKPLLNKGLLRASVTGEGPNSINKITANSLTIGTNRPGANLMQRGGTVTPTKAKALTIPLTKEATRFPARNFPRPLTLLWRNGATSGVLAEINNERQTARSKALRRSARLAAAKAKKTGKTSFATVAANFRKAANAIDTKRKAFVAHYALVKSVTVPARPFIGFGQQVVGKLESLLANTVRKYFRGGNNGP